jgi:hypothetical protein
MMNARRISHCANPFNVLITGKKRIRTQNEDFITYLKGNADTFIPCDSRSATARHGLVTITGDEVSQLSEFAATLLERVCTRNGNETTRTPMLAPLQITKVRTPNSIHSISKKLHTKSRPCLIMKS